MIQAATMRPRYDRWAIANFVVMRSLRNAFYHTVLKTIALSNLGKLWPAAAGRGMIYCLHKVSPESASCDMTGYLAITPHFLGEMILAAREAGLTPVALEDLPALLADPSDTRKFVCFTLDDGYRDNATYAAPVFQQFKVPYSIFINAGFVERTHSMWWENVREVLNTHSAVTFDFGTGPEHLQTDTPLQKLVAYRRFSDFVHTTPEDEAVLRIEELTRACHIDPIELVDRAAMNVDELQMLLEDGLVQFGGHTLTHVNLRRVSAQRLRDEIAGSTAAIKRYVGKRPRAFAYPYGDGSAVGKREMQAVADAGYEIGVTTRPVAISADNEYGDMGFGRVTIKGEYQARSHIDALISGVPLKIRW